MGARSRIADSLGITGGPAAGLFGMLVVGDVVLVALHISRLALGRPDEVVFSLGSDRGFGEAFFAVKMLWLALLGAWVAHRHRSSVLAAWSACAIFLLLDDQLRLHERFGRLFGMRFESLGYLGSHLGEIVWLGGAGLAIAGVLVVLHLRSGPEAKAISAVLFAVFAVLVLFGVVVDGLHGVLVRVDAVAPTLAVAEDAGELVVLSAAVAFLFAVAFVGHRPLVGGRLAALTRVPRELQR